MLYSILYYHGHGHSRGAERLIDLSHGGHVGLLCWPIGRLLLPDEGDPSFLLRNLTYGTIVGI